MGMITDRLRIRLYQVRFGDAILVSVPDADDDQNPLTRHILIDVGNVLGGEGGDNSVFVPVLEDIANEVGERGIDLYVMTHEHLNHVQGLLFAARHDPPLTIPIHTVWATASADPSYYASHPEARKALDSSVAMLEAIRVHLSGSSEPDIALAAMVANNSVNKTRACVDHILSLAPGNTHFVYRGFDTAGKHPFKRATFDIWAPEEDTAEYYGRFRPMGLGTEPGILTGETTAVAPPAGVDTSAFYNLVEIRSAGPAANALAIDRARNNTSVVFALHWNDRVLLFAGDAEDRSWRTMERGNKIVPVDFLKVAHHGSRNGTPGDQALEKLLPADFARPRIAGISTCSGAYNNVPDEMTLELLRQRCTVVSTADVAEHVDVFIG